MTLAAHVRTLGRGPGRARSLTLAEAQDAMQIMLSSKAAPEATGALLMLLRMKGETADETAGLARAARADLPPMPSVDLDWPSYAAGRTRGLPWFLLSARLLAQAGHRVLLHGWNGPDGAVRAGLSDAGITRARQCPRGFPVSSTATESPICRSKSSARSFSRCCACAMCWGFGPASTPCAGC